MGLTRLDVDDPTPQLFDVANIVDPNGPQGNDNLGVSSSDGIFVSSSLRNAETVTDGSGVATSEFQVGSQPGNNYRVAVALQSGDLINLNVDIPNSSTFVASGNAQVKNFRGKVSPMLTVWRKLHIEVDSMEAVATNGTEANFETGAIDTYTPNSPATGFSTINLDKDLKGGDRVYENGRIEIAGLGTFSVLSNIDHTFIGDDVIIQGTPGAGVIGQSFKIYDDDDRFLNIIGLPAALPKDDESTNLIEGIRFVYVPAYIDVINANAEGLNPNKRVSFKLNEEMGLTGAGVFDDAKDLHDSTYFWAHTITIGYQGSTGEDLDPNSENPLLGSTLKKTLVYEGGISAIYIESLRDAAIDNNAAINIGSPALYPTLINDYWWYIEGVIAHEIGHAPGGNSESSDHAEGNLMQEGAQSIQGASFSPATIKRFRSASEWVE